MGRHNYYFLIAGLPDLTIDQGKLQFGSLEFREYLKSQLHKSDYQLIEWLFLPHDNLNLLQILKKTEVNFNNSGIYTREELELAIAEVATPDKILSEEVSIVKPYIKKFLVSYFKEEEPMPEKAAENELLSLYFKEALKADNTFFRKWLEFEINLKNVLIFNTAQNFNIPLDNQLVGDTALVKSLKQRTGRDIGEAAEWEYYDRVNQLADGTDIFTKEKAIDQLRWTVLDEMNTFNYFSIEIVFSYMVKIMIIERWLKLDPKTGEELFRRLLGDLQSSYEFPNEFSIKDGKK